VVAVRDVQGKLQAPKSRKGAYAMGQWLRADGDGRTPADASNGAGWQCDAYACVTKIKGQLVSLTLKPDALQDDCQRVSILVSPMDIRVPCPAPKLIFDRGALWEKGAAAITIRDGRPVVAVAADSRGVRPWATLRRRKEKIEPDFDPAKTEQEKPGDESTE
jgi:competence protein ComEC